MFKNINKKLVAGIIIASAVGGGVSYWGSHMGPDGVISTLVTNEQSYKRESVSGDRNTYVVKAVEKSGPAVVGISTKVYQRDMFDRAVPVGEGVGSGVIYDKDGHIITNYHVIAGSNGTVRVSLSNGQEVDGKVIGGDKQTDLAVVQIDPPKDIQPISLGSSADLHVGEPAIAIGNPLGLEFKGTVTVGVISALNRTIDSAGQRFPLLQTDAAINPGNSGGALLNADGQLIGINSAKIAKEGVEGIGFAIPIDEAKAVVDALIKYGKVVRPYLGLGAIDKTVAREYGYNFRGPGLLIMEVDGNGPATSLGLSRGDVLTEIDGNAVNSLMDLKEALDKHKPGDSVTITINRSGQSYKATVQLGTSN